jgi:hypothetical protein
MALWKRQVLLWGFTAAGIGLLFIAGLFVSYLVGIDPSLKSEAILDETQLGWWRAVIYSVIVLFWPRFVSRVIPKQQQSLQHPRSRAPLVILIILYECLIVQNPLSVILAWVG